jgi:hypothetical protein
MRVPTSWPSTVNGPARSSGGGSWPQPREKRSKSGSASTTSHGQRTLLSEPAHVDCPGRAFHSFSAAVRAATSASRSCSSARSSVSLRMRSPAMRSIGSPRCPGGNRGEAGFRGQVDLPPVDLQDLDPVPQVRAVHQDRTVETADAQQSGVEHLECIRPSRRATGSRSARAHRCLNQPRGPCSVTCRSR